MKEPPTGPRWRGARTARWLAPALLVLASLAADAAPVGAQLRTIVMEEIARKLPHGVSLEPRDAEEISKIALMIQFAVHAPDYEQIREAVNTALAAAPADANPTQLKELAFEGLFRGYGHRSRLIDLRHPRDNDLPQTLDTPPAPEDIDGLRIARLANFNPASWDQPKDCSTVLERLSANGLDQIDAIVLDLRGNEGGSLVQIACIASAFLKPGTVFFLADMKNIGSDAILVPESPVPPIALPLVLLVDEGTDSGGMLFAASMQFLERAKLVGAQKAELNGDIFNVLDVIPLRYQVRIPTGTLRRPDQRALAEGVHIDVPSALEDRAELLRAARAALSEG